MSESVIIKAWKKRYEKMKQDGICVRCGGKTDEGLVVCKECRAKYSESERSARQWLKARGICTRCRKRKALNGKTQCSDCLNRYHGQGRRDDNAPSVSSSDCIFFVLRCILRFA